MTDPWEYAVMDGHSPDDDIFEPDPTAPPTDPEDDEALWAATFADETHQADADPSATDDTAKELWDARPVLAHIHDFARARRASPWAVLGVVLARVVVATPPFVVLPALVGGHASLNLFVGLVGLSGAGKGAAEQAADDVIDLGHIETWNIGSGEGIAHLFMHRETRKGEGKVLVQHADKVLMNAAEIDTLTALTERRGATILAELRKAWVGERLGFAYADPEKRLPVAAHSYRLGVVAGIQPGRAAALLNDSDGGTPQRLIWLPANDPDAPKEAPDEPTPMAWRLPDLPMAEYRSRRIVLPVCDEARAYIDAARLARLHGEGDALDAHTPLARLKIAAALALLNEQAAVDDEDWALAGLVMAMSQRTRTEVVSHLHTAVTEQNRRRGEAEADRAVVVEERVHDAAIARVARTVTRRLARDPGEWVPRSDISRAVAGRDRTHLDTALERLADAGQIDIEDTTRDTSGHGGTGRRYRITEGTR